MKVHTFIIAFLAITNMAFAQNNALWLRTPALSPDGNEIVFSYKGDLFKVPANGGAATPLTLHEAYDATPVWSPDGKQIAFASDRYGNLDVFTIPSQGGEAKRLTAHSGNDIPSGFSPDGKEVLFSGNRNDVQSSARFPNKSLFRILYKVPATGGRNILISSAGFQFANYDATGENIVFQDRKGYEDELRKKHTSSVTRDIWIYNTKSEKYTQVSDFEGEDREPVFSSDGKSVYYLSEKKGSQNVFNRNITTGAEVQLTSFKDHPVRHLSRSKSDALCFSWNGEIYTLKEGNKPSKVMVQINADFRGNEEKIVSVNGGATEMALSPNGKEMAFVFRGEVFVTSTDNNQTKRITNTPAQERTVNWGSDSRTLFYATERGNSWDIYKATINRKEDLFFFAATQIDEEGVITTNKDEFQPQVSPNGKEIAYLEQRNELKIFNLQSKISRTIIPLGQNFSYSDGDQAFNWSPDSKSIIARSSKGSFGRSNLVWYDAAGDKPGIDINVSGFGGGRPQWMLKGKALSWTSAREGKKPLAIQGPRETDVYAAFFSQEEYDRFLLSKEDFALEKDKETKEKEALEKTDKEKSNEKNKATDDKLN
jgi:Tol biopolymer transport system component